MNIIIKHFSMKNQYQSVITGDDRTCSPSSLITREEFEGAKSHKFVDDNFKGSLPSFIASFVSKKKLSTKEIDEIQKMIDKFRGEE